MSLGEPGSEHCSYSCRAGATRSIAPEIEFNDAAKTTRPDSESANKSIDMNDCVRKRPRQGIGSIPTKASAELDLQLLRAAVSVLQGAGLLDHDALEPAPQQPLVGIGASMTQIPCRHGTDTIPP